MKKMALLVVMVCLIGGLMVQQSQAAFGWFLCTVNQVGTANPVPPGGPTVSFQVWAKDGSFGAQPGIYVYMPTTDPDVNRNMAAALTALSLGNSAWVYCDPTAASLGKVLCNNTP